MGFRKVVSFCAVLVLGCAASAKAQVGIYGMATGQRFTNVNCPSFVAPCASNDGVGRPYGGTFGVYYDWKDFGPTRLGFDVRGDVLTTNKRADNSSGGRGVVRQYAVLAGPRVSFHTPIHWLRPYAEITGGYTRNNEIGQYTMTNTTLGTAANPVVLSAISYDPSVFNNYGVVRGFVGLDIPIFSFLDLRAIELGEGVAFGTALQTETVDVSASGASTVTSRSYETSTHGMQTIGAGLVLRFGH